jgi:hypothetical protein
LAGRRFSTPTRLSVRQRRLPVALAAWRRTHVDRPSRPPVVGRAAPATREFLRQNFTTIFNVTEIGSQCLGFASRCCYRPSVCEVGVGGMKRDLEAGPLGGRTAHRGAQGLTVVALFAGSLRVAACVLAAGDATAGDRVDENSIMEDVQLRSACAASAQQILERNFVRSALYQDQFWRFSPSTNRCYVEIRVQTGGLGERSDRFGQYLYDGETRELLAFAQIQNGRKSGKVFDLHHPTKTFENAGWDDASEYIYTMMAGDR